MDTLETYHGGVISNLRSPLGGRAGEREVEVEESGALRRGEEAHGQRLCVVLLLHVASLYIVGRGWPCPSPKAPRAVAKERRRRPGQDRSAPPAPTLTLASRLGLMVPLPYPIRGTHMALMGFLCEGPIKVVCLSLII
jgi:hypothetical protein